MQFNFRCKTCKGNDINFQANEKAVCLDCGHRWKWKPANTELDLQQTTNKLPMKRCRKENGFRRTKNDSTDKNVLEWMEQIDRHHESIDLNGIDEPSLTRKARMNHKTILAGKKLSSSRRNHALSFPEISHQQLDIPPPSLIELSHQHHHQKAALGIRLSDIPMVPYPAVSSTRLYDRYQQDKTALLSRYPTLFDESNS